MVDLKNASRSALKAEYKRIAKITGDDQFMTKKELRHLPEILMDGEQILAFSSGIVDNKSWLITLTDRRVVFLNKGLFYGLEQVSIPLEKISSVSCETGLMFGKIHIGAGSDSKKITNVLKKTVIPFTNKVQEIANSGD